MTTDTSEKALDSLIVASLTGSRSAPPNSNEFSHDSCETYDGMGYVPGDSKDYDRSHVSKEKA
jgi:hypothetical protein